MKLGSWIFIESLNTNLQSKFKKGGFNMADSNGGFNMTLNLE